MPELPEEVLWEHRCSDGVGGCTAISAGYLDALLEFVGRVATTRYWHEEASYLLKVAREDGYEADRDGPKHRPVEDTTDVSDYEPHRNVILDDPEHPMADQLQKLCLMENPAETRVCLLDRDHDGLHGWEGGEARLVTDILEGKARG